MNIERIDIYETYNGGGVVKISAQETGTNNWHVLWSVSQPTRVTASRIFSPTFNVSEVFSFKDFILICDKFSQFRLAEV